MLDINEIEWIANWTKRHCDGAWEHENSLKIYSTSNPGWALVVSLLKTKAETLSSDSGLMENSEDDWYIIKVQNGKFEAHGDLMKLNFMVKSFREMMEKCGETI